MLHPFQLRYLFLVIAVYRAVDLNKVIEIKYNKREIVIGMSCFLVAAVCLNQSNMLTIAICFLFCHCL